MLAALSISVAAQQPVDVERRALTIPMRDGTRHSAIAFIPRGASALLPIILVRTPFVAARIFRGPGVPAAYQELAQDGYIFVAEDIRGRGESGGTFITNRAQNDPRNPPGINESTDAYDAIDWLVKNLPDNSGRVGVMGTSYQGWLAGLAGVGAHPALKAISPQAPTTDTWMGDDFFHQGAFRMNQAVAFAAYIEGTNGLDIPDHDQFAFYLRQPTLEAVARATGVSARPSWLGFVAHPAYDGYWQGKAMQRVFVTSQVPTLFVGGFWDEEDLLGAPLAYHTLERADTKGQNRIVMGPWNHGQWNRPGGDTLGALRFGSRTADEYREKILRPWFAYYLHDTGDGRFPEAWVFESGSNAWRTFDAWPPRDAVTRQLYLRENGLLAFEPPPARAAAYDAWTSDPAHPVPYMPRPDDGEHWGTWMQQDQRFVDNRPDVRTWTSAPLASDLTLAGDVTAHLFASTTGSDADWVVKLIDVYPDSTGEPLLAGGHQLIVNADIMRGRYWKGFGVATPIPPNTVTPFTVALHEQLHRFKRGHRLMVQVQSSWFPLYDRNPQQFVPNIFRASASDYAAQEHRVWHTPRYPSHLSVQFLP